MASPNEEPALTSLEEFRSRAGVIRGEEADRLRALYVERFVDTTTERYLHDIGGKGPLGDDVHYSAYLWDTLKHPQVITEPDLLAALSHWNQVYVFWDLHSERHIYIPNYWKFPKDAVLRASSVDLTQVLAHDSQVGSSADLILPEDLYFFDDAMSSSLITTHEYVPERYCLWAI